MAEEGHIDLEYFADVEFDLSFREIGEVLERMDGTSEPYEAADTVGSRRYSVAISEAPSDEDDDFERIRFSEVADATPPKTGDFLLAKIDVRYDFSDDRDTFAPDDSFLVRFTNDGFEMFTDEHYLRTSPTELFDRLGDELETGP